MGWAIGDLRTCSRSDMFDTPSKPTATNFMRIEYLFSKGVFDLPDRLRPDCHRLKTHTYRSVYGRLRLDQPAQTITSGFGSMGQGRYVHPTQRRMITPHEAARLQMIPDYFDLREVPNRTALAEIIGNAVPPKLAFVFALELLR
jgi:DNA (cytosine-5)-methyltransferase 1